MVTLVNRAKMSTATSGTGVISLGSAVDGYQSFASAGVVDGDTVTYVVEDGTSWEIGSGVYSSSGATLTRSVVESSNAGSAISLSGSAVVYVSAKASDIKAYDNQYVLVGTTSNATETELFVGGVSNSRVPVPLNKTMSYQVDIVGRRTDASGTHAAFYIRGVITNAGGAVSDLGSLYEVILFRTSASIVVDVRKDDASDALGLFVTGISGNSISWKAVITTVEV